MAHGEAGEPQTVFATATDDAAVTRLRITAGRPEVLLDLIDATLASGGEVGQLLVDLDSAVTSNDGTHDNDELIALGAVLVQRGINAIETTHVRSVRRLFDTHAAIVGGSLEAIRS